ncbi:uncharacterized protein BDV17DRAFT_293996 [Aspergillus undulatus]|uniref:uncharacterized protein n=1 Tax=Aspergillus undulatus TaxID=1810928 RepID=UPI003CCD739E
MPVVRGCEEIFAKIDNYDGPELGAIIKKYGIRNPDGGATVLPPVSFNLNVQDSNRAQQRSPGYLRPETAQGQFLNFKKLLDYNQNSMPFASALIGESFRNEVSPRSGLLRVGEFLMAEIGHFVDPEGLPGKTELSEDMFSIVKRTRTDNIRDILKHAYWHCPNDPARGVLSLPISVAPTKVLIVSLSTHADLAPLTVSVSERLRDQGISCCTGDSSNDELGIPLVDFDSVRDDTMTLCERDSTKQVRASQEGVLRAVRTLVDGVESWDDVSRRLPEFLVKTGDE